MRCRLTSRDDANSLTSPGVDNNEKVSRYAHTEDHETVLIQTGDLVRDPDREFVDKDRGRVGEADAVLSKIGSGLVRIPLIVLDCMHACAPSQEDPASSSGKDPE